MTATSGFLNRRLRTEAEVAAWRAKKQRADTLAGLIPVWEQRGVSEQEIWPLRVEFGRLAKELDGRS